MVCKPRPEGSVTEDAQQGLSVRPPPNWNRRRSLGDVEEYVKTQRRWRSSTLSYPRVPFVALILPIAAPSSANVLQALDQFNPHDVFCMLVAELTFDAEPQRRP